MQQPQHANELARLPAEPVDRIVGPLTRFLHVGFFFSAEDFLPWPRTLLNGSESAQVARC